MIALDSGLRIYLACGVTDMRKGMTGLAMLVQQSLAENPFDGAVYAFRGRRAGQLAAVLHRMWVSETDFLYDSATIAAGE